MPSRDFLHRAALVNICWLPILSGVFDRSAQLVPVLPSIRGIDLKVYTRTVANLVFRQRQTISERPHALLFKQNRLWVSTCV